MLVSGVVAAPPLDCAREIRAGAPGSAFLQGEPLRFTLTGREEPVRWTLRNWRDEVVRQGEWPRNGELTLNPLVNGYYKLELSSEAATFDGFRSFVVAPDPDKREKNPDMFFAVDSAQSWLAAPKEDNPLRPGNAYAIVAEAIRRAGILTTRDRLRWNDVERTPGKFTWKQYQENADLLAERGIRISGVYHDAPPWAKSNTPRLPSDLLAAYRFARKLAEHFRGKMSVWEFWNEPDIGFAPEGAWDYAAALKAASLGFKAGNPDQAVAIGGYAQTPLPNYCDIVMRNGAADYFDIFNVHTYAVIRDFPAVVGDVRAHMARHGISGRTIWYTENGSNMEGAGKEESDLPGIRRHSADQEFLVAEYLPKMMIAMQSLGVARDFFFVMPPYNENAGKKDWGLMRHDFTVKPGYAALATLTDQLGNAALEGEVALGEQLKGFLYRRKDGGRTLVFWSISDIDTRSQHPNLSARDLLPVKFALPFKGKVTGVDLFGTPFEADAAELTAIRFPAFAELPGPLPLSVPFVPPAPEQKPLEQIDKTIVFRTELSGDFGLLVGKDGVDVKSSTGVFKLQIWNLSEREKSGTVAVAGGVAEGLPGTVTVPAFTKAEYEVRFTPALDRNFQGELKVTGEFDGRKCSPLVIPLQNLKAQVSESRPRDMPQLLDPIGWRKNSSGELTASYLDAERAISFATKFPANIDRWTYPEYELQLPQESLKGAQAIAFEAKSSDPAAIRQMLVMLVLKDKKTVSLKTPVPRGEWGEILVRIPPEISTGDIVKLRIGINSRRDEVTYCLRNMRIFYAR